MTPRRVRLAALMLGGFIALGCGGLDLPSIEEERVVREVVEPEPVQIETTDPIELDDRIDLVLHKGQGANRPIVLQFSDWRCPHCYRAMPRIRLAAARYRAQLRFRSFPLAGPCNPTIEREDPERCALALGAICAHRTGQFDDFSTRAEGEEGLIETLSASGAFADCMQDPETEAIVRDQAQSGADLGLQGTPTFFVRVEGTWYAPGGVDEVLELLDRSSL